MPRKITPRKNPSQDRSRATVEALVEAASQVLESEGEKGLTTNRIARRAGVSIGTLYQYFPNKEALLLGLVNAHHERMREAIRVHLEGHRDAPIRALVHHVLEGLFEVMRLRLSVNLERFAISLGERSGIEVVLEELHVWVRDLLDARRDEFPVIDTDLAAFLLVRALDGVVRGTARQRPEAFESPLFSEYVADLVVKFLAPLAKP